MCTEGTTRTVTTYKMCDNNTQVSCQQSQVCKTITIFGLQVWSWWSNTGDPVCDPCPNGPQERDKKITICCFVGVHLLGWRDPADVFLPHDIPEGILPPGPKIPFLYPSPRCIELDANGLNIIIENIKKAKEFMIKMNLRNWVSYQDQAIRCLENLRRDFNW